MENWNYAHAASRGTIARRYPYNYEMGLGRATRRLRGPRAQLPGRIIDVTEAQASENNQRGFYRAGASSWRPRAGRISGPGERRVTRARAAAPQGGDRGASSTAKPSSSTSGATRSGSTSSPRTPTTSCPCAATCPRDEPEREFTREGVDVNWFDEGKDTLTRRVKQIRTGVHWAEEPPSRICHMVSNVQLMGAPPDGPSPAEVARQEPLSRLPQPRRDGDRLPGRQARGPAPPGGRRLAHRPAQDHPRPERPAGEEPDVLLLTGR